MTRFSREWAQPVSDREPTPVGVATPSLESVHGRPGWQRGFWSLILTQFQGGFNDNALKYLVIYIIVAMGLPEARRDFLILVVGALFALPFILFSMAGGYLADRYSKRSVTIGTKFFEIGVMVFAAASLAMNNLAMEAAAVFLISSQGAFFGPSKYGLMPELLPEKRLSWGNGILELGTFLAAITGTMTAGILAEHFRGRQLWSGLLLLGFTLVGLSVSYGITRVPAAKPEKRFRSNPLGDLGAQIQLIRKDRVLGWAVLGNCYLFFIAALLQFVIVMYGHDVLHIGETQISYLQAAVGVGIGVGSLAAGYLSGGKIEYGLIPMGAMGITVFAFLVARQGLSFGSVATDLVLLGFFGGFYAVPINALIQHQPNPQDKGSVIAAANLLSFVGIFLAAFAYNLLASGIGIHVWKISFSLGLHLHPRGIFLAGALMTLAATLYTIYLLPDSLLRFILWLLTHTLYRVKVEGRDNISERGGALLVPNHVSMADAAFLIATVGRPVRFLMFKDSYEHLFIKPFAKILRVIPISSQQRPREMIHALHQASDALRNGEIVCIFPEGQMTRIGQLLPFRRGMERIMKGVDVPIIPVSLDGVWGSVFSFAGGRFLWKFPRRIPYPVNVTFGRPLPPTATSGEARQAVQELAAGAFARRKRYMRTVPRSLIQTARRHPFRFAMADGRTPRLTFGAALAKTLFLARRLRTPWRGQEMVGILLPPSIPGALVNYAALLAGKVPVNLNYTASSETLASYTRQCNLKTVITSRAFLERIHAQPPAEAILLEDLAQDPPLSERLTAALAAFLLPARWLPRFAGGERASNLDDLATIIFSSGSTGDPKGVVLTHYNLAANVEQLQQIFLLNAADRILGILPFFHSFGFTGTLCLPAVAGIGVVFHPNPLEARVIGGLVSRHAVTMLLATPTFLQAYARRCAPEDFGSLRYVIAGAEKLPERIAQAFEDQFGIRPLEGYGCTECSPVVAVNTRDYRAPGFRQVGAKRGSIGHPLPGMDVRIVDPVTFAPLPAGQAGLLIVRGPNVMRGYWQLPAKTEEVLRDGWYVTGDIAALDEDGFLRITDRMSRFSKIGGEMVPHIKVEDKLQELAGEADQVVAVTSVPDEKKGERLVVLHTLQDEKLHECLERLAQSDLPALWKPRPDQFHHVEALPYLGTGKLDLRRLREMAIEQSSRG